MWPHGRLDNFPGAGFLFLLLLFLLPILPLILLILQLVLPLVFLSATA